MNTNRLCPEDSYALKCIRVHVQRLVVGNLIQSDEVDDVCHTVYCDFLRRRRRYDGTRGSFTTFTSTVVRNLVSTVAKERAETRRRYEFCEYSETTAASCLQFGSATTDAITRKMAVSQAVDALPLRLRSLAAALYTESVAEISQRTGTSRSSLYAQAAAIRKHWERIGFTSRTT